jgi:hypothetical protein
LAFVFGIACAFAPIEKIGLNNAANITNAVILWIKENFVFIDYTSKNLPLLLNAFGKLSGDLDARTPEKDEKKFVRRLPPRPN